MATNKMNVSANELVEQANREITNRDARKAPAAR